MAAYTSPLEQEIKDKGRFVFVADFVAKMTRKKADRALVNDYQVKCKNAKYTIFIGGHACGYKWMTAEEINSWFPRLPLSYFAMQAEELVIAVNFKN